MDHARGVRLGRALVVVVTLAASAPPSRAACAGFGAGAPYAAGGSPQAVTSGDFNRDGVTDLAVANLTGPPLTLLRGTGGGAFAAPVSYAGGSAGRAIAASDFNGDGITDLAVGVSDGIAIWIGAGDGTFTGGGVTLAGSSLRGIACADFDRDGITDLAVTSSATGAVLVLRGNGADGIGNGTFGAPVAYAVGTNPARILAADLDGDGITDLAVANNSGASVSILRGTGSGGVGNGGFAAATSVAVTGSPWSVVALDWNGDGVVDLAVSNGAGTTVALLRGTGAGAFAAAGTVTTPTAPRDMAAGDFDGDGVTDVAAACAVGNSVSVLRGTGAGLATLGTFATGSGAGGLAAGDWNGDGAPDLACVNTGAGTVTRLLASCPPAATARVTLLAPLGNESWWPGTVQEARWTRGAGVASVNVDLSRDGGATWLPLARGLTANRIAIPVVGVPVPHLRVRVADALVPGRADASAADLTLCGLFGAPIASVAGLAATRMASADLDGDAVPDLVVADASHASALRGDGSGRFTVLSTVAADSTRRLALADVTGDGLVDLVRLAPAGVAVRPGDGRGHFGAESWRTIAGSTGLVAADLDGDGIADIAVLAADGAAGRLVVWRSGTPGAPWTAAVADAPGVLASADLDGDGIADLVLGAGATVQVWYGTGAGGRGDGAFREGGTRTLPAPAGDLALGDSNRDGAPDVIACIPATGDIVVVPSPPPASGGIAGESAPGAAPVPLAVTAGAGPCAPVGADLDGDGRLDVAVALANEGSIAVLAGSGGGFAAPARFAIGASVSALLVDDFTGDGQPDAVVAGTDGRVYCLPAQCPPKLPATLAFSANTFADTSAALAGFVRPLAWSRGAAVAAVRIELSRDGGTHWTTLADGVTTGSFRWTASGPACAAARLRVRDAACGTRFDAGATFSIRDPFAPGPSAGTLGAATRMATGDADGDGVADAVVTGDGGVQLLRGDGTGGFAETWRDADEGVRRVRLADVDGDGTPDLLTLHATSLSVRRGDGAGAFGAPEPFAMENGAADFAVVDADEDGVPDLVTVHGDGIANRVSVRRGLPAGSAGTIEFAAPWYAPLPAIPAALAIADLNADGVPDLVVAHAAGLATLLGNGSGGHGSGTFHLAANRTFGGGRIVALCVADLDGDGRVDVAAADDAGAAVLVAAGDGAGGFGAPALLPALGAPVGVTPADLDHDGTPDLVAMLADGTLFLQRGVPGAPMATRFAPAGRFASGSAAAAFTFLDVDADGVADAVALDPAGSLRVLRGRSAPAGTPRLAQSPASWAATGSEVALRWSLPAGVTAVDVELSRDGGLHWSRLASGIGGGAWTWTVSGPCTFDARLRVRDASVPLACDSASAPFRIEPSVAGVGTTAPAALRLGSPWPNPARSGTRVELSMPATATVRIEVCDVAGRHARTLLAGVVPAGVRSISWAGDDDDGRPLAPGLYFIRARTRDAVTVRRVAIAR
jgi:hypothetical protein